MNNCKLLGNIHHFLKLGCKFNTNLLNYDFDALF